MMVSLLVFFFFFFFFCSFFDRVLFILNAQRFVDY